MSAFQERRLAGATPKNVALFPASLMDPYDHIPDVRDGLTRQERIVLYVLHDTQKELGGRNVPTAMLWGRVCEYFDISPGDLSLMLARLGSGTMPERPGDCSNWTN